MALITPVRGHGAIMAARAPGTALIVASALVIGLGACLMACPTRAQSASPNATPAHTVYSASALYNLANSYARAGQPALAVLNYQRARLLAPHDPDIEANLRYVREASHLPPEPQDRFTRAVTSVGPTALSWMGLVGVFMMGTGSLATRASLARRMALGCGIVLAGLTVGNAVMLWPKLHEAVVLTAATPARVSPVPMGDPLFVLPEAETVRITAEREDFVLVQTKAGRAGWVSRANLAPVVPR
jgi:hypothetical protein